MDVGARFAVLGELPEIAELVATATETLRPQRGGELWFELHARQPPVEAGLREAFDNDRVAVVVGCIDDCIVGYAIANEQPLHGGAAIASITDLFVLNDARGVGVGAAIMEHVTQWARQRNLIGMDSLALPGDRVTKNFFESSGMVARAISVYRPLEY